MRARIILAGILMACALGLVPPSLVAAQVHIGVNIGVPPPPPPRIVIATPPRLVVIPRTPVYYAPAVPHNYFFYGGRYYVLHNGAWFYAPAHHGPWTFIAVERVPSSIRRVPVTYYKVPPGHLKEKGHGKGHKHKKHKDDN